jgi:hypothetical protein
VAREAVETWWDAIPSPGGTYLLVWYDGKATGGGRKSALINMQTLELASPWQESTWATPLDDGEVLREDRRGSQVIGPPDGPARPLRTPSQPHCKLSNYLAINNGTILGSTAVDIDRWCYTLATTDGQLLFSERFGEKEIVKSLSISAGGRRFALAVYRGKGGSWAFDIPARYSLNRIVVYDITKRQWVYTLEGKKQGIKSISGLALSPDGTLLALINQDGILEVYRLPPAGSASR